MPRSDRGNYDRQWTQFASSQFQNFSSDYGFDQITSSPLYPQSNGEVEQAVKTVNGLWKKNEDPFYSLLIYNAMPLQLGYRKFEWSGLTTFKSNAPEQVWNQLETMTSAGCDWFLCR